MNADIIAARRRLILDSAKCEGCGATLAACKARRGKNPTAPPWFGCCARGFNPQPCRHVVDAGALAALLVEIESGSVRTVAEAHPAPLQGPRRPSMGWLLHQDMWWQPKGRPPVRIADMDKTWRYNTVQFLERSASQLAAAEQWSMITAALGPFGPRGDMACDAFDAEMEAIGRDPLVWLRRTAMHRALSRGLPTKPKKAARLAERARHWSTCPMRLKPAKSECCGGSGLADYAAAPCQNPACPVETPRVCTCPQSKADTAQTTREVGTKQTDRTRTDHGNFLDTSCPVYRGTGAKCTCPKPSQEGPVL